MGISRIKSHLSGIRGHDVEICLQVPVDVQLAVVQAIDTPSKKAKSVAASNNTLEGEFGKYFNFLISTNAKYM